MEEKEDLLGVLIKSGIGSRRKVAAAVIQGRVTVNGIAATGLRQPVDSGSDRIVYDGKEIVLKAETPVYLALNKPPGVLSTVSDERGRKTVTDCVPEKYRYLRLYPAGRLDKDSTGLLLLTNDGELTNRLTHPRYEHEKEYLVTVNRELTGEEVERLKKGVELEDGMTAPAKVSWVEDSSAIIYSVIIHEGRKRQVRRMFQSLKCSVLHLKRIRIGRLTLGNLKEGEVKEIEREEIKRVFG